MTTYRFDFFNPASGSLHFAEGGFTSAEAAWKWAQHSLAVDHRWGGDEVVQRHMAAAVGYGTVLLPHDLRLAPGEDGELPVSVMVTVE